jgi:hypothetical protein
MIVVASHDNINFLQNMLNKLSEIDLSNHDVLIVNTNSTDSEYINYFTTLPNKYSEFKFDTIDYDCWDSGAYIHAYRNYKTDKYIFLQDSITIMNKKLIPMWDALLDLYDVVPFINFGYGYENEEQKTFVEQGMDFETLPSRGIFGPIFGVNRSIMDKLPNEWLITPSNKSEGCGMERRWSLMFHIVGATKHYMELENFQINHTIYTTRNNIHKHFMGRL